MHKSFKKLILIFIIISILILAGFAALGDSFDSLFNYQASLTHWRENPAWGWAIGVGALISDIVLPLPATGIMAALGKVYGFWLGTLFSFTGSFLAGLIGYYIAKLYREKGAHKIVTPEDLENFKALFDRWGGIAIVMTRALPILPEVMTVMAGLAGMKLRTFLPALTIGSAITAAVFTLLGIIGNDQSIIGLVLSVLIPAALWLVIASALKLKKNSTKNEQQ